MRAMMPEGASRLRLVCRAFHVILTDGTIQSSPVFLIFATERALYYSRIRPIPGPSISKSPNLQILLLQPLRQEPQPTFLVGFMAAVAKVDLDAIGDP